MRLLARLAHPHIARLLDAGRSDDGHPWFVMEAVDGRPIDQACRGLPLAARLHLFLQLVDAVEHAHRQGLVHRDLKPANVLVDAAGQVRLLDFGIARAHDLSSADDTPLAARPLTPGYASPEQVRGEPAGPASDVYALGVLLHVLVTGVRPYGLARQGSTTAAALLRAVLEEAPTRPSQAPQEPDADAGVPRRQLAGDLDAIVLKALAKSVSARYASAQALSDDLRALLDQRPVAARSPTPLYVAGRFVARHRGSVAALLVALLAVGAALTTAAWQTRDTLAWLALGTLAVALAVTSWQAQRASRARDHARAQLAETSSLVRDVLMRYADMATYLPGGLRLKGDLLADSIAHLERLHLSAPHDAPLAAELAKAHARLADLSLPGLDATLEDADAARRHAERALALFPAGERAQHADPHFSMWWARAMRVMAKLQRLRGEPADALATLQRMRRFLQAALKRFPADYPLRFEQASGLVAIGQAQDTWLEPSLGRSTEALATLEEAQAAYAELARLRPDDGDNAYQLGTIAGARQIVLQKLGRLAEAVAAGRQALQWREQALALQPDNTGYREGLAGEANNLAILLLDSGQAEEALALTLRGEALMAGLEAADPQVSTWTQRRRWFALHLGRALLASGRAAEALPRLQQALLAMATHEQGPNLGRRGWCALELARTLRSLGQEAESRAAAAQAAEWLARRVAEAPADATAASRLEQARAWGVAGR
jgi:eukaryotic-like serine/threonine-protein kinase